VIVGIDLGTTNSLAAYWDGGAPRLIPNSLGTYLTPSCVSLDEDGAVLVGRAARERLQTHPGRTASLFKRHMGTDRELLVGGRTFRPEELSALVLRSLKADAEAALGGPVEEAVITVPAYFSDAQRKATRAAGELAGLRVERLLNEPSAAALAYGIHRRGAEAKFLVFDLGGGTFDVSILDLFEGVMEVRASAGDNFLGGEDFDTALLESFFPHPLPSSLKADASFMQRLRARTEEARHALGASPQVTLRLPGDAGDHVLEVTEGLLDRVAAPLLQRLRIPVERALRDADFRAEDLDQIVLAGGATRMAIVRRLVARMFGRPPVCELNPDEVVALGAAVQAGLKMKDAALDEVVMTDVSPYSMGIEISRGGSGTPTTEGHFDPIIERNTPVPVSRVGTYYPVTDHQRKLLLNVYQGEARMVRDNIHLGRLELNLPPGTRDQLGVDIRFTYDVNGLLEVEARVLRTGALRSLVIESNPGILSPGEIAARFKALSALKVHPREQMANRALLARAERLYLVLKGPTRQGFGDRILAFEQALESQDPHLIRPAQRDFSEHTDRLERDHQILPETIQ